MWGGLDVGWAGAGAGARRPNRLAVLTCPARRSAAPFPQLIARMGRWLRNALTLSYLKFFKPSGLLAAAGWDKDRNDGFFSERFCIAVPDELVAFAFPGLAALEEQVWARRRRGGRRVRCWHTRSGSRKTLALSARLHPCPPG